MDAIPNRFCYCRAMTIRYSKKAILRLGALIAFVCAITTMADNWPEWRGPEGIGVCSEKNLPTVWGTNQNVRWKTALPGPGNSTPVIWRNRVFVTQAVEKQRMLMC